MARFVRVAASDAYTYLTASGTWRASGTSSSFDSYGMASSVTDHGDLAKPGDETCTRTWYARNDAIGLTTPVSRTRVVAKNCGVSDTELSLPADAKTRGDVLSDTATVYDSPTATGWSALQTPTKGEATWTGRAAGYPATADADGRRHPSRWITTISTTYDTLGRPLTITDAGGNVSTTAYTPADAGPLTRTIATDAKGFRTVTFLDPRRGQPLRTYDPNLKKTELAYDALGRLTAVWLPNRSRGGGQAASRTFSYQLSNTQPSAVAASTLKADGTTYNTTYTIYDALLRELQTQSPTPQGGRLLTDTRYDSRGNAYETFRDIFDTTSTPNGTYTRAEYGEAPNQTETVFDGAGRPVSSTLLVYGVKKWTTTTTYTGDSTAVTAVQGGSARRTITDARGRTVETRDYASTTPADAQYGGGLGNPYASMKYDHTPDGKPLTTTGPDGARWTYTYDLLGRLVGVDDPDKGAATTVYNDLDQIVEAKDARGARILTAYDELGRVTGSWSGTRTDADQLTEHTYDTLLKGKPTSSTRYVGGRAGKAYTRTVTA